jgi:hypothetical protein
MTKVEQLNKALHDLEIEALQFNKRAEEFRAKSLRQRNRLQVELEHAKRASPLGEDIYRHEDVIFWRRTPQFSSRTYRYVAIKLGSKWWVTGENWKENGISWEDLSRQMTGEISDVTKLVRP